MDAKRKRARELASAAVARGEPTAWFEQLYRESAAGAADVPWADLVPNPFLVQWLDREPGATGGDLRGTHLRTAGGSRPRALDVGCGLGDNAEELARRGYDVVAFDVAGSAIEQAERRFPGSPVGYVTADLLSPPPVWRGAFDLVVETYTLQVLPPRERVIAAERLRALVAPGGTLLVIARGREASDPEGSMPWPLTRAEVGAIATADLVLERLDDFMDGEEPAVRRLVATFRNRA